MHASALTASSEFFKSALKEEWKKSDDPIDLQDHSVNAFNAYLQWLYSGNSRANASPANEYESMKEHYIALTKLYALGEHLNDTTFQDYVINSIIAQSRTEDTDGRQWYPTSQVNLIYESTSAGSPARRLMVDFYVHFGDEEWITNTDDSEKPGYDFLIDVSAALLKKRNLPEEAMRKYAALKSGPVCEYHNHDENKPGPVDPM